MKFKVGDRVITHGYAANYKIIPDGLVGTVDVTWAPIGCGGRIQNQYFVLVDGRGGLVYNEDQLEFAVLDELARL